MGDSRLCGLCIQSTTPEIDAFNSVSNKNYGSKFHFIYIATLHIRTVTIVCHKFTIEYNGEIKVCVV